MMMLWHCHIDLCGRIFTSLTLQSSQRIGYTSYLDFVHKPAHISQYNP